MDSKAQNIVNAYLAFRLGDEFYAVNVSKVISIIEIMKIARVANAPKFMLGVINYNDNVIPVIDCRMKFGLPPIKNTPNTCIIVLQIEVEGEQIVMGTVVDGVQEVMEIEQNSIHNSQSMGKKYRSEFITGILAIDQTFIMILDMDKVFSNEEALILLENSEIKTEIKESEVDSNYLEPAEYAGFYIDAKEL